jgi:hypothetical protein
MTSNHTVFGFTCEKCSYRGDTSIETEWIGYDGLERKETPEGVFYGTNAKRRYTNPRYPERCTSCDTRYKAFKRASESIARLEIIRRELHRVEGDQWKYLKFVTMTTPTSPSMPKELAVRIWKKRFTKARAKLSSLLDIRGGTDVIEVVERDDGTHHVHSHGVWLMPYHDIDTVAEKIAEVGFGRDQIRAIKEEHYEDSHGEERTMAAHKCAAKYLAKYLTKEQWCKRMAWGELRKWKQYLHQSICRICVKTTTDLRKQYPCNCHTEEE